MKIFCIGRNYVDHAKELNNAIPTYPMVFMKPPTALLLDNKPFFIPEWSENIHFEGELVVKIKKNGKYIQPQFAKDYIGDIAFGIDFTARDVQSDLKEKSHPWEIAKGFDNSAAISKFISCEDIANTTFQTIHNGEVVQNGKVSDMIFDIKTLIVHISKYFTLQQGDYIYTGTPAGVGQVKIGDTIEGVINGQKMISCQIK